MVVDQAAQYPGAALGRLDEQRATPLIVIGQLLAGQLAVFQLERRLDAALQGDRERDRELEAHLLAEPDGEDVAPVLDVGDDPLLALDGTGEAQAVFLRG